MIPIIEDAVLGSHLDFQDYYLLNVKQIDPVPLPLISSTDSRLSDGRIVPTGSVTDDSVAATAAISQSKLSLDGNIPAAWLGNAANQAAQGDLVERVANKGVAGGYAPLDANNRIPAIHITPGPQTGTVSSVDLKLPGQFAITGNPITSSGSFTVTWNDVPDSSWFGVEGIAGQEFITSKIPLSLIPDLDAAKFTSGTFDVLRLPEAIGVGASHAIGILPDPDANGDPADYLGRDMKWRHFDSDLSYQPAIAPIQISLGPQTGAGSYTVIVRSVLKNSVLFYRVNGVSDYLEVHLGPDVDNKITLILESGDFVEAYAAKSGWNNSPIATYVVQPLSI